MRWQVLELFAGIGGVARAFEGLADVVAAVDINQNAKQVYSQNFQHPYHTRSIEDLSRERIESFNADTWWVSAPCQPFTRRGKKKDEKDRRAGGLGRVIRLLTEFPPQRFLLENVVGFEGSKSHAELTSVLLKKGFQLSEFHRCPTEMGIPNRRPRFYLAATRDDSLNLKLTCLPAPANAEPLSEFLDDNDSDQFNLADEDVARYSTGLNVVDPTDTVSNCFTSGYAKSLTKSGSYLRRGSGSIRRFSPLEISRLLGFQQPEFSDRFVLPGELSDRQLWKLLGNSISVFVVRDWIRQLMSSSRTES